LEQARWLQNATAMRTLLMLALVGCGGSAHTARVPVAMHVTRRIEMPAISHTPPPASDPRPQALDNAAAKPTAIPAVVPAVVPAAVVNDTPQLFGSDALSVRFKTNTIVYVTPATTADRAGIVSGGTRSAAVDEHPGGDGCTKRWIEIAPRGWVCEAAVEPSHEAPTVAAPATLDDDSDAQLGTYGVVVGANPVAYASRDDASAGENAKPLGHATSVRAIGMTTIDGKTYWIITDGSLIDADSIVGISPSQFHGVAIADKALAVGWVHRHDHPRDPAELHDATGAVTGEAGPRARVTVREISTDGASVRITDTDWIARVDLRMPSLQTPPDGTAADAHWFDVDLDDQVLVAYEGATPVYATLVSTGRGDHATPEKLARITTKYRTADMVSTKTDVYSVADVPWTMYYDGHFALHTSYWHDGFGDVRSHGCVNLAPRDARALYGWSSPDVPAGWVAIYSSDANQGSVVRIHSSHTQHQAV
jgi:hypothetical protein